MNFIIGEFDKLTNKVAVIFSEAGKTVTRFVNACLDDGGEYDHEATQTRVSEVAPGVSAKISLGLIGDVVVPPSPEDTTAPEDTSADTEVTQTEASVEAPTEEPQSAPEEVAVVEPISNTPESGPEESTTVSTNPEPVTGDVVMAQEPVVHVDEPTEEPQPEVELTAEQIVPSASESNTDTSPETTPAVAEDQTAVKDEPTAAEEVVPTPVDNPPTSE